MENLLHGPDGAIGRFLFTRAEYVKRAAVIQCNKRTGKLSQSILKRPVISSGDTLSVTVGAYQPYAIYVHEGTKPHIIRARNANVLAFYWPAKGTGMFFFKSVNHPGYKGNKFLTDNLRLFFT